MLSWILIFVCEWPLSAPGRINEKETSPLLGIDNDSELFKYKQKLFGQNPIFRKQKQNASFMPLSWIWKLTSFATTNGLSLLDSE